MIPAADELKARYETDGFVSWGRVLAPAELATLSDRIDGICAGRIPVPDDGVRSHAGMTWKPADGPVRPDAVWQLFDPHRHDTELARICALPAIRDACGLLLGGPARLPYRTFAQMRKLGD